MRVMRSCAGGRVREPSQGSRKHRRALIGLAWVAALGCEAGPGARVAARPDAAPTPLRDGRTARPADAPPLGPADGEAPRSSPAPWEDAASPAADGPAGAQGDASTPDGRDADVGARGGPARRSAGCGKASPKGELRGQALASYILVVPAGYSADEPQPVLFAYPGAGGDADGARRTFRGVEGAMGGKGLFVYPSAVSGEYDRTLAGREVKAFDAILAKVADQYCVDLGRVFATGFSQGAGVSLMLSCARPQAIRGAAPNAGDLFHKGIIAKDEADAAMRCGPPTSLWATRGADDNQAVGLRTATFYAMRAGCATITSPTPPSPCRAYTGCKDGIAVVWCPHGGGHEVPSFAPEGIARFIESLR
jgi:poly(3-hydroxybutyrate) depolymerase